jgi:hypothetical protein
MVKVAVNTTRHFRWNLDVELVGILILVVHFVIIFLQIYGILPELKGVVSIGTRLAQ